MFGLGIWEFALILVVALLVLGPEKMPRIARQAGRALRELRRAASEFQASLSVEVDQIEKSTRIKETLRRDITDAAKSSVGVEQASTFKDELRQDIEEVVKPVADIAAEVTPRPDPYATAARTSKQEGETEDDEKRSGDASSDDQE